MRDWSTLLQIMKFAGSHYQCHMDSPGGHPFFIYLHLGTAKPGSALLTLRELWVPGQVTILLKGLAPTHSCPASWQPPDWETLMLILLGVDKAKHYINLKYCFNFIKPTGNKKSLKHPSNKSNTFEILNFLLITSPR